MAASANSANAANGAAKASVPSGEKVQVYLYDLSQGMAAMFSSGLIGKKIDGIWHTGIIVYGTEYFYGGGITYSPPGGSMAGKPMRVIDIGYTEVPQELFHEFLNSISNRFTAATYSLLKHNCNNFTNECSQFLTGKPIPDYITGLPEEALNTPMGQMLRPMLEGMEKQMKGGAAGGGGFIPWAEGGALSLPRIRSPSAAARAKAAEVAAAASSGGAGADSKPKAAPASPAPVVAAPAPATPSAGGAAAASGGAVPAGTAGAPAPNLSGQKHAHFGLGCTAVTAASRAHLSAGDKNVSTFLALIKQSNKKAPAAAALSEEQLKALSDIATALGESTAAADSKSSGSGSGSGSKSAFGSASVLSAFETMLNGWPPKLLFGTLGLFRLAVLKPEVASHFEAKAYPPKPAAAAASAGNKDTKQSPAAATSPQAAAGDATAAAGPIGKLIQILPKSGDKKSAEAAEPVATAVQIMALCTLSNLFGSDSLCARLSADESVCRVALHAACKSVDKTVRVAGATLLYNVVLFYPKTTDGDFAIDVLSQLAEAVTAEQEAEPASQLLLCLSHLIYANSSLAVILTAMEFDVRTPINRVGSYTAVPNVAARIKALCADLQKIIAYEKQRM